MVMRTSWVPLENQYIEKDVLQREVCLSFFFCHNGDLNSCTPTHMPMPLTSLTTARGPIIFSLKKKNSTCFVSSCAVMFFG